MTKQFLIANGEGLSGHEKKYHMIKTYSFTIDDDDAGSVINSQSISNHDKLLSINSPSIDNHNMDDDLSELSSKLTKRKSRRQTELENHIENKRSSIKKRPWYQRIDLSTPLMVVGMLIFFYFMWIKRDVWIHRLLTSNARIHRSVIARNEPTIEESVDSSSSYSPTKTTTISPTDSPLGSSHKEDVIENAGEKDDVENNEDSTKSSSTHKINIRIRRTKMSFNKERQKKKRDRLQDLSPNDNEEEEDKPIKKKEAILPLSIHSKTKHQHRGSMIEKQDLKTYPLLNSIVRFSTYNDIIKQLRKYLKSQRHHRDFFSTLSKTTGLNKNKLYRFIYNKNDYQRLTLQTFISILDSFNLTLLIVQN